MAERAASPPMTTGARRLVLLAAAACLLPLLLQLPASLGIGFGMGALVIALAAWRRPLPALLRLLLAGMALLAVAAVLPGIGRDTACAVLAAMLALKPAETVGLRDGRSLVGFALFAPFSTFLLDQGPVTLMLAVVAAIAVLAALQRNYPAATQEWLEDAIGIEQVRELYTAAMNAACLHESGADAQEEGGQPLGEPTGIASQPTS